MRKIILLFLTAVLFGSTVSFASCTANEDSTIVVNQPTITRNHGGSLLRADRCPTCSPTTEHSV